MGKEPNLKKIEILLKPNNRVNEYKEIIAAMA
jgi:hypothetical protein